LRRAALMRALASLLVQFLVPAGLLAGAFLFVAYGAALPPGLSGLRVHGPYIVFALGAGLAAAFNRGRALLALLVLCGAYGAQQTWLQHGIDAPPARAVYLGLALFVPVNLALLAVLPERGVLNRHVALRGLVILAQVIVTAWAAAWSEGGIVDWAYRKFLEPAPFSAGRLPQLAVAAVGLGLLASLAAAVVTRAATPAAMGGAILAFAVAAHVPTASLTFSAFISMAQLMVVVAVLQDTFHMAFRDELTGLPSRRALNEQLAALGSRYAIAMIDVDHFKKFNDTHGHDLGDQVLRMVATHIARVGGGGRSYRYGGEEFTILFPGKDIGEVLPHLEALRGEIEGYRLALRGGDRPRRSRGGKRQRGGWRGRESVSVTVSIGVAERSERLPTPQAVIEAADRALYRAKSKGRNRVSR
jgi:diguanylate cyclase (GGDEF)-like protein